MANTTTERKDSASFNGIAFQNRLDPHHLRALVLDYLCHYSFADTARTLIGEDAALENLKGEGKFDLPTEKDVFKGESLKQMRLRREIRQNIITGNVDKAIELISVHFPSTIRGPSDCPLNGSVGLGHSRIHYNSQTSVNPAHISLNLNILSFIELSRTIPLDTPQNSDYTPIQYEPLDDPELHDMHIAEQIRHAQQLNAEYETLTDSVDKTIYQEELKNVISILAYPVPEKSPAAKYLSQERRDAVAEQVNSAILHHLKRPAVSYLELYTRYITAIWSFMHDMKVEVPASQQALFDRQHIAGLDKIAELTNQEQSDNIVPPFSLMEFLDSR